MAIYRRRTNRHTICKFVLFLCISLSLLAAGCSNPRKNYLEKLKLFEEKGYSGQEITEEDINRLESEITLLEEDVREYVNSTRELGTFYKMAGTDFFDGGNYLPAIESFEKAMEIQTENHVLPYYAAVATVNLAKSTAGEQRRRTLFEEGEFYYLRSLDLKPSYDNSMYGLAVLYLYEMNRPWDALEYIRAYLEIRSSNVRGHFVLAASLAAVGNTEEAVDAYRWIIEHSGDNEEIESARSNIDQLLGGSN